MKLATCITELFTTARVTIAELAKSELNNTDRKNELDRVIKNKIFVFCSLVQIKNPIIKFAVSQVIEKWVIPNVSVFTQCVYDALKRHIEGVTR